MEPACVGGPGRRVQMRVLQTGRTTRHTGPLLTYMWTRPHGRRAAPRGRTSCCSSGCSPAPATRGCAGTRARAQARAHQSRRRARRALHRALHRRHAPPLLLQTPLAACRRAAAAAAAAGSWRRRLPGRSATAPALAQSPRCLPPAAPTTAPTPGPGRQRCRTRTASQSAR